MDISKAEYIIYYLLMAVVSLTIGSNIGLISFLLSAPEIPLSSVDLNITANELAAGIIILQLKFMFFGWVLRSINGRMRYLRDKIRDKAIPRRRKDTKRWRW